MPGRHPERQEFFQGPHLSACDLPAPRWARQAGAQAGVMSQAFSHHRRAWRPLLRRSVPFCLPVPCRHGTQTGRHRHSKRSFQSVVGQTKVEVGILQGHGSFQHLSLFGKPKRFTNQTCLPSRTRRRQAAVMQSGGQIVSFDAEGRDMPPFAIFIYPLPNCLFLAPGDFLQDAQKTTGLIALFDRPHKDHILIGFYTWILPLRPSTCLCQRQTGAQALPLLCQIQQALQGESTGHHLSACLRAARRQACVRQHAQAGRRQTADYQHLRKGDR